MTAVPPCRIYHYEEEGMSFKVTSTLHARKVEEWIRVIQEKFVGNVPIMCVGLDVEYTDVVPYVKQRNLPLEQRQRTAVLQLFVAYEILVFQIVHADAKPQTLRDFWEMKTSDSAALLPTMT
jgi:hypothetical protein